MDLPKEPKRLRIVAALIETFGFSPAVATFVALGLGLICLLTVVWVVRSSPPRTIVVTTGPEGSSFQRWALLYQTQLATRGVKLVITPSNGSLDNLQRLQSPKGDVDIGFVSGGLAKEENLKGLVSLGSVAYQPLLIFHRLPTPITRLSELAGKRVAIGAVGSGTRALALTLLLANGISGAPTTFVDLDATAAAAELMEAKLDAVFLMGDSASLLTLRTLVRSPDIQLFNFTQADAYVRRNAYLNKITLPQGSFDLGKNLPAQDVALIGPTVELVAHKRLNSALSDLLIEVAQEVHGKSTVMQKRGEFPAPLEHEFPLSKDALRFYKSGKGFFATIVDDFWLASLLNRSLVAIVPLILVLVPAIRYLPVLYRLGIQLRFYRWYRPLLRLERDTFAPLTAERVEELIARLDEIEQGVSHLKVPASFASQFYWLRSHIAFVRDRLKVPTRV
ncbi:MAG: TAXI family TRAP transporter solute-binding subunit [Opitutus sp.]